MSKVSEEVGQIDIDRRGIRLTENKIPREIAPLVRAVNAALSRLDDGYARQERFIAAAAHELRTPITILRVKIEAADIEIQCEFQSDVARLSNLAEQLLDLHRLEDRQSRARVDPSSLVRDVVADLAPLLISLGKSIEVETSRSASRSPATQAQSGTLSPISSTTRPSMAVRIPWCACPERP